jgi:hypothetical protein
MVQLPLPLLSPSLGMRSLRSYFFTLEAAGRHGAQNAGLAELLQSRPRAFDFAQPPSDLRDLAQDHVSRDVQDVLGRVSAESIRSLSVVFPGTLERRRGRLGSSFFTADTYNFLAFALFFS